MTMILGTYLKQPADRLDVDIDFSDWLEGRDGDTILSAISTVDDAGLNIDLPTVTSPIVKQWFDSGVDGSTYKISITATTAQGRIKQVECKVRVKEG